MNGFFEWMENQEKGVNTEKGSQEFTDFQKIWETSAKVDIPEAPNTAIQWAALQQKMDQMPQKPRGFRVPSFVWATAFAALLIGAFVFQQQLPKAGNFETARGERLELNLPDQSIVELNADSTLTYGKTFNRKDREVFLRGEAWFSVEKGKHPFLIHAGFGDVRVVGTQFNVYARDELFSVGVNEGIVEVSIELEGKEEKVVLKAGERIRYNRNDAQVVNSDYDEGLPAWRRGKLLFDDQNLEYVRAELSRYLDIDIQLSDPNLAEIEVSGLFQEGEPSQVIANVCATIGREFRIENGTYIIY